MRGQIPIASAGAALLITTGISAAPSVNQNAHSVYAASSLVAQSRPTVRRCGSFTVTRATYGGVVTSPEPSLAGRATLQGKLAVNRATGYGLATGSLTIRSGGRVKVAAGLTGVISNGNVVNGLISGRLLRPAGRLIANTTLVFNENFTFAAVRLGIESGQNSAVVYVPRRTCP